MTKIVWGTVCGHINGLGYTKGYITCTSHVAGESYVKIMLRSKNRQKFISDYNYYIPVHYSNDGPDQYVNHTEVGHNVVRVAR
jgi:hypothetical protein